MTKDPHEDLVEASLTGSISDTIDAISGASFLVHDAPSLCSLAEGEVQ